MGKSANRTAESSSIAILASAFCHRSGFLVRKPDTPCLNRSARLSWRERELGSSSLCWVRRNHSRKVGLLCLIPERSTSVPVSAFGRSYFPGKLLTFAFCSPIVRGGRGNGKRVARRLHCRQWLSRDGRRPLKVPSRKRGEGSAARRSLDSGSRRVGCCSGDSIGVPLPFVDRLCGHS